MKSQNQSEKKSDGRKQEDVQVKRGRERKKRGRGKRDGGKEKRTDGDVPELRLSNCGEQGIEYKSLTRPQALIIVAVVGSGA